MYINSDNLLLPETDETVYVRQIKIEEYNPIMVQKLKEYLKKRKCVFWMYLAKIETINKDMQVFEKEHYCLIIKPDKKFHYQKDANAFIEIMSPFVNEEEVEKFIDVSVIGWLNTMQFNFKKEDCIQII